MVRRLRFVLDWRCFRCPRRCFGRIGKAVKIRYVPNAVMGTVRTSVTGSRWEDVRIGVNLSQKTGLKSH